MKRYLRILAGLIGLLVLCLTQLAATSHAGITGITFRINLSAATVPTPAVQPTVTGAFTYGITCIAPSGLAYAFLPAVATANVNSATPISALTGAASNTSATSPNTCTVSQLSRPAAPAGYLWNGSPPNVVVANVNVVISAQYEVEFANVLSLATVTTAANPPAGGTVACNGPSVAGGTATCTATANPNYRFTGFTTSSCGAASATSPYITAQILSNCTVTGAFALVTYTVTGVANPAAGGTVVCASPVNSGSASSCTATANTGYSFAGFSSNGCGAASINNPYATNAITGNCTVTAAFNLNTYPITTAVTPAAGGTVSCAANPVPFGSTATCTATANAGYTLTEFTTSSCGAASASNPYITSAITSACTVTAAFSLNTVPVTTIVNIAAGGSVTCTPNPVVVGNTVTCTTVTNSGYVLTGLSGCGGATTTPGTFVTAPITAACSVTATFAAVAVVPSVPVQTLSMWMLILLGLLTVGIGSAFSVRRPR